MHLKSFKGLIYFPKYQRFEELLPKWRYSIVKGPWDFLRKEGSNFDYSQLLSVLVAGASTLTNWVVNSDIAHLNRQLQLPVQVRSELWTKILVQ